MNQFVVADRRPSTRPTEVVSPSRLLCLGLLTLGLSTGVNTRVFAADAATDSDNALQEVIVHARRREEKLGDVPVAVSVETGAQLAEQSAVTIEDALREIPNTLAFKSARSVSALEVTMRGQTAIPSAIFYDPAVGLYIDGVYVANGQGAMGTLLDIDSVEVVRGAQGTLFGRNNTGGSISLNSHRPELNTYAAELSASAGNESLFGGRGIVNLPIGDTLAVRIAFQNNQHQGWGSSIATGQNNFMSQHRDQLRAGALWQPTSDFDAYFTYERFTADEVGALLHPLGGTLAAMIPGDVVPTSFYQTDTGKIERDIARTEGYTLTLREHFSDAFAVKLILSYRDLLATNSYDADAMAASIADVTLTNTSYQKTGELQFSGAALDKRLDWVAGLYGFRDNGGVPSSLAPGLSSPYPTGEVDTAENKSSAAFGHVNYHLTGDWTVAAGLRHTNDRRSVTDNAYVEVPTPVGGIAQICTITDATTGYPAGNGGPCPNIQKTVGYSYWSWEGSLGYRISDATNSYLRVGRAQRSGGWNVPLNTIQDTPFRPEQLTDVELGIKSKFLDGRGMINAAIFTGKYDDMQRLEAKLVQGTPVDVVINAGRARVSGLELDGQVRVTEPFSVQASFGYTEAKYLQFIDTFGNDASANKFYMTPKFQWSLAGLYDIPLPDGKLRARADYTWRDRTEFNVFNDNNYSPAVGLLGARLAYANAAQTLEAALFGTNLLDKQYAYNGGTIVGQPGQAVASWQAAADRRLYGIELTYRFRAPRL